MSIPEGQHQSSQELNKEIQAAVLVIREGRFLGTGFPLLQRESAIPS